MKHNPEFSWQALCSSLQSCPEDTIEIIMRSNKLISDFKLPQIIYSIEVLLSLTVFSKAVMFQPDLGCWKVNFYCVLNAAGLCVSVHGCGLSVILQLDLIHHRSESHKAAKWRRRGSVIFRQKTITKLLRISLSHRSLCGRLVRLTARCLGGQKWGSSAVCASFAGDAFSC